MKFVNGQLTYKYQGELIKLDITLEHHIHPNVKIQTTREQLKHGELLTINMAATNPVELVDFTIEGEVGPRDKVAANGFQTWSQSREYGPQQRIPRLFTPSRPLLAPYGDYHIHPGSGAKGQFHSWSWISYPEPYLLLASTAEDQGYTLFMADLTGKLKIRRDCQGQTTDNYPLLQVYIGRGCEAEVWDEYAGLMPRQMEHLPKTTGWTSWYNYYTKINEPIILDNLQALWETGHPFDVFQIDDGWQAKIGDWQHVNSKFPGGMEYLAKAIKGKGFRPGLWLAPFICEKNSRLWQENYDWVLKDEDGKPVKAGWNPGWSGWFYALDFYAPGFQDWLREVFDTVLNKWGYQMVKLDFLYAVALRRGNNRCRGRIMAEAMEFLRRICRDKHILGCGVPLAQSAGRVEYCRIGADVAPYWEDKFLKTINYRERVSTKNSLYSTLHRRMLDRRFFRNDPDVFILRDGVAKVNENKLSTHQRHTLFMLNNLLGGLIFLSDHVGEYTPEQKELLAEMFPVIETEIKDFTCEDDLYTIQFKAADRDYVALVNLGDTAIQAQLPQGAWFSPQVSVVEGTPVDLEPHQSLCLVQVEIDPDKVTVLGSSGHLWPGAQIQEANYNGESWDIKLKPHSAPHTKIYLSNPPGTVLTGSPTPRLGD